MYGCRFDVQEIDNLSAKIKDLGLSAIKEQVRMLEGDFEIWSQSGKATKLSCLIHIQKPESSHSLHLSNDDHS